MRELTWRRRDHLGLVIFPQKSNHEGFDNSVTIGAPVVPHISDPRKNALMAKDVVAWANHVSLKERRRLKTECTNLFVGHFNEIEKEEIEEMEGIEKKDLI